MLLNQLQTERPTTGTYTVITLTDYSCGESELTATTVKEPAFYKKKSRDIEKEHDDILNSVALTDADADLSVFKATEPKKPLTEYEQEENKQRSLRRAKSNIRKRIIEGELDHFLTLTYKENKIDVKEAWKDWKKFIRLVVKKYPNLKYLVIVERQKRGAIHFHAAVHGYMHANTMRALWLKVVGQGNIDIKRRRHNQSLHGLAKYITKYLTKQYDELENFKNLYRCSKNIKLRQAKFYLSKEYAFIRQSLLDDVIKAFLPDIKQIWSDSNGLYSTCWASSLSP